MKRIDPSLPLALFTDLDKGQVHAATEALAGRRLFDLVLADGLADFRPRNDWEARLLKGSGDAVVARRRRKLRSRLGRLLNLGKKPFDLTLYVDDDTYFCPGPSPSPLIKALRHLYATRKVYDVRAQLFARDAEEGDASNEAKRCVWTEALSRPFSAGLEAECSERTATRRSACGGAQGGALAVAAGERSAAFVADWVDAYPPPRRNPFSPVTDYPRRRRGVAATRLYGSTVLADPRHPHVLHQVPEALDEAVHSTWCGPALGIDRRVLPDGVFCI